MAKRERTGNRKARPIIIRREDEAAGSHHGGAWKVAYADFVTAMMAFFLVMWLINATTEEQRKGLADYFSPTNLMSHNSSGTGKPFGGETAFSKGSMVSDKGAVEVTVGLHPVLGTPISQRHDRERTPPQGGRGPGRDGENSPGQANATAGAAAPAPALTTREATRAAGQPASVRAEAGGPGPAGTAPGAGPAPVSLAPISLAGGALADGPLVARARPTHTGPSPADRTQVENHAFAAADAAIKRLILKDPRLAAIASQLAIDITPRGLRIQLLDSRDDAMFRPGSAEPNPPARRLLRLIGPIVAQLAGPVRIAGFTDAAPFPGGATTNWDLSAARANAARRLLTGAGLADSRIEAVTGHGSHELLLPKDPLAPANRRISILVLRGAAAAPDASASVAPAPADVVPAGVVRAGAVPIGAVPTGAVPTGAIPTGAIPAGGARPAAGR
ncbi:MAG TPA: flagellar motor protein MotB [Acetobacteraceae bacterium]|nr:flagellar motor protein MotB [Acetobacteraceae bacterium]